MFPKPQTIAESEKRRVGAGPNGRRPFIVEGGGLCRRFTDLSGKIASWEPTPANLKKARAERLKIEKDERPVRRLIDLQSHNEECRARGFPENQLIPLSWAQRTFGYVLTFGMPKLEKWRANSEAAGIIQKDEPVIVSALPHDDEPAPQ